MATKTRTRKARTNDKPTSPILHPPPTPAELKQLIEATLAAHFPQYTSASLILVPAPGIGPVEMQVRGNVMMDVTKYGPSGGIYEDWWPVYWEPKEGDGK